jgi:hypothetical protein
MSRQVPQNGTLENTSVVPGHVPLVIAKPLITKSFQLLVPMSHGVQPGLFPVR